MLTRDLVFDRVTVDFASPNSARVAWSYHRNFIDPEPYQTQLQFGYTGTPDADDWTNVGSPATNVFVATDTVRRAFQVKDWVRGKKAEINIAGGFGSMGGYYPY